MLPLRPMTNPGSPHPLLAAGGEGMELFHKGSEGTHFRLCGCVISVTQSALLKCLKNLKTVLCLPAIKTTGGLNLALDHGLLTLTETRSLVWLRRGGHGNWFWARVTVDLEAFH